MGHYDRQGRWQGSGQPGQGGEQGTQHPVQYGGVRPQDVRSDSTPSSTSAGDYAGQGSYGGEGGPREDGGWAGQGTTQRAGDSGSSQSSRSGDQAWASEGSPGASQGSSPDPNIGHSRAGGTHTAGSNFPSGPSQHHFDPDYEQWRNEQIRRLDDDYRRWREDRDKNQAARPSSEALHDSGMDPSMGDAGAQRLDSSQGGGGMQSGSSSKGSNLGSGDGSGSPITDSGSSTTGGMHANPLGAAGSKPDSGRQRRRRRRPGREEQVVGVVGGGLDGATLLPLPRAGEGWGRSGGFEPHAASPLQRLRLASRNAHCK